VYMNIDEALIDRMLVNNAERTRCLNEKYRSDFKRFSAIFASLI